MASKLKVDQLRAELSLRGLDTSGNKPTLVKRLEAALRSHDKEEKDASLIEDANGGRKRKRGSGPSGAKNDLQRIEKDEEPEDSKEDKLAIAAKKARPMLDKWLSEDIKSRFHVLEHGEEFYDAALNQTNVGENNNKFYVIQALESNDGREFMVYTRWGRVGVKGQEKLHGPYISQERAIKEFEMKFSEKTKNQWSSRKNFICYPKSYAWLEMDYSQAAKEQVENKVNELVDAQLQNSVSAPLHETKLEHRIAKFISLISDTSMMKQQMLDIGYNAEKMPLGKLSKTTILKGYEVLRRISDVIGQAERKTLEELSGEFYTVIPHDFGFRKMRDFVIDRPYKLKLKLEMVAALGEIEIANKLLQDIPDLLGDPLYAKYCYLNCELAPVEIDSKEFSMIKKYMQNTHAETHSNYTVDIVQLFRVSRHGEGERFKKFSTVHNRMLLWHGSRLTNWIGILSQGLRIAPPEAPLTGYMFGKGVYFADMFSKSANYCHASTANGTGVLLLCEVALGDMAELLQGNCQANNLPQGKLSTKGVGATQPDMSKAIKLEDGLLVPFGKPKKPDKQGSLLYNEYIVYNVEQILMRYVIQVKFNFSR
ncbi:Poly [ADP-ribose] polymerase 2 [Apostasia shenzhenica]|uniref:Poly [ADP-ribose] polymerase n=1 Tax=Apostasia shenzhenica TaxID=1088818 RepID=A0A2I0A083_9ASPA|nr:Poly [ADP-ribose] polymerase 2 [Apostasia shenzhenica]